MRTTFEWFFFKKQKNLQKFNLCIFVRIILVKGEAGYMAKKGQSKWNQLNFFKQIISSKCQTRANVANEWTNLLHQWTDPTRLWIFLLLWQVPLADEISFSRPDGASSAWRSPENSSRTSGSSTIDAHARLPWLRQSTFTQSKTFNRLTLDLEIIKTAAQFKRKISNSFKHGTGINLKFPAV